jgi:hypothetical protein
VRKIAHYRIEVSFGLGRERLVQSLVQFVKRQTAVCEVLTQLSGGCLTISVPNAHVVSRSHRALRSQNGESQVTTTIYRDTPNSKPELAGPRPVVARDVARVYPPREIGPALLSPLMKRRR